MTRDLGAFEQVLEQLQASADPVIENLFDRGAPLLLARAPGRLDVMGGFADYSGSLTLEMPIAEAAFVAVQEHSEPVVRVVSLGFGAEAGKVRSAVFPLAELREHTQSHAAAREYFNRDPSRVWTAYVAGIIAALQVDLGQQLRGGLSILVASNIPEGKGVSSSAALEVATFSALAASYGLQVAPIRAAMLCQRVENLVVGAPCGVMDQLTSMCGVESQLLPVVCQPAELQSCFAVPAGLAVWGIDSGLRHQVSGADYTEVRVAAFMGYAMIARSLGLRIVPDDGVPDEGRVVISDDVYRGYLANVAPAAFEQEYRDLLPETLRGADFLREFPGITDPITRVVPEATYRVRAATAHPIYEHRRAAEFRQLMQRPRAHESGQRLGSLMFEAHESYRACGLGSTGTDRIVELVQDAGPGRGLYGAKITGGGSGGTVAVLGRVAAERVIAEIIAEYASETGHTPYLFRGSSPGAAAFGTARVSFENGAWRVDRPGPRASIAAGKTAS
jgi:L-arabinokinase